MNTVKIKTAANITSVIMTPFEILYCIVCALLLTLPIYCALQILFGLKNLFTGPQDEKKFKYEVEQQTGKQVHIAVPGLKVNFNKQPF